MTWSTRFTDSIASEHAVPRFILQTIPIIGAITAGVSFATHDRLTASVMTRDGIGTLPIIAEDGIRVQGARLSLREWSMHLGGFTVDVISESGAFLSQCSRGALFELRCGFAGFISSEFQTITIGQLVGISRSGPGEPWTLRFRDIFSAMQSRWTTTTAEQSLFHTLGTTTTVATAYTAGAGGALEVASTANFDKPAATDGALKVSTSGGDFFTTYTGTSGPPTAFDGLPTANKFNTDQQNAAVSDVVTEVGRLLDEPLHIFAAIVTSTGLGTNGTYDLYPKSWGFGLDARYLDESDLNIAAADMAPPSGTKTIDLLVEGAQANGLSWLLGWMSEFGVWPVLRQGKISARPIMPGGVAVFTTITQTPARVLKPIADGDIVEIEWEAFHPDYIGEVESFQTSRLPVGAGAAVNSTAKTEAISHLPSLSTRLDPLTLYGSGANDVMNATRDRMGEWQLRIPERIRVRTRTLYHSQLVPGDFTTLTTKLITGRLESTRNGYNARRVLVTEVTPDWTGANVSLELAVLPDKADEFD